MLLVCASAPAFGQDAQQVMMMENAKATVKGQLRDPDSAKFSNVRVSSKMGVTIVCGLVNSKNGFGGYNGNMRFMSAGGRVTFDQDDPNFAGYWQKAC